MKIDLCKLLGVEEGEEFKFNYGYYIPDERYKIENNQLYKENDVCDYELDVYSINDLRHIENIIKLPKKKKFSQDTLNFFKMIDKKYEWVAKDKNESVTVFQNKPTKNSRYWETKNEFEETRSLSAINQNLFDQILWEDEEPIRIDDYVER